MKDFLFVSALNICFFRNHSQFNKNNHNISSNNSHSINSNNSNSHNINSHNINSNINRCNNRRNLTTNCQTLPAMLAQANSLISTLNQEAGEQVHFKHLYFMDLRHFAKSKFFLSHFY